MEKGRTDTGVEFHMNGEFSFVTLPELQKGPDIPESFAIWRMVYDQDQVYVNICSALGMRGSFALAEHGATQMKDYISQLPPHLSA